MFIIPDILPWTVGNTFDEVCQSFKNYVLNNYGTAENITVVFDGYLLASTKGINIMHSDGNADLNVVSSALTFTKTCPLTLPGEDADPLILLL